MKSPGNHRTMLTIGLLKNVDVSKVHSYHMIRIYFEAFQAKA